MLLFDPPDLSQAGIWLGLINLIRVTKGGQIINNPYTNFFMSAPFSPYYVWDEDETGLCQRERSKIYKCRRLRKLPV